MFVPGRTPIALAAIALGLAAAGCSSNSNQTPHIAAPSSWHVIAGSSASSEAYQALRFYPAAITIDAGDSVTWSFPALEPHTVSFPVTGATPVPASDPNVSTAYGGTTEDGSTYASSGFLLGGKTYTLTFPKPGTYTYYSLIHQPEAVATVVVNAAGTAYPKMQSDYDALAQSAIGADISAAQSAVSQFPFTGSTMLAAGISPGLASGSPANSTVMRFLSTGSSTTANVTVPVGTTIVWTNEANQVPHDVVFPVAGQSIPSTLGPFAPASGPSSYDGSTLVDSGVIPPGGTFSLTFTKAGTYSYHCLFHDDEGMISTVTVQ